MPFMSLRLIRAKHATGFFCVPAVLAMMAYASGLKPWQPDADEVEYLTYGRILAALALTKASFSPFALMLLFCLGGLGLAGLLRGRPGTLIPALAVTLMFAPHRRRLDDAQPTSFRPSGDHRFTRRHRPQHARGLRLHDAGRICRRRPPRHVDTPEGRQAPLRRLTSPSRPVTAGWPRTASIGSSRHPDRLK